MTTPINEYDEGTLVIVSTSPGFQSPSGTLIDPSTVKLDVITPDNVLTTTTYGGSGPYPITRVSTGIYQASLDTTGKPGRWQYRWYATGTGQAAATNEFFVRPWPPIQSDL